MSSSTTNTCVANNFHLNTVEAATAAAPPVAPPLLNPQKGIVTILGSDSDQSGRAPTSLRRNLSADISSKNWLPINKVSSSGELAAAVSSPSSEEEDDEFIERPGQDEIWNSIQAQKLQGIVNGDNQNQKPITSIGSFDWTAILSSQKTDQDSSSPDLPPPYIHPLVKKSSSSLSKQSLEICTESLGTETGDSHHIQQNLQDHHQHHDDVKTNHSKKFPTPSFPPPLPSLATSSVHRQGGGGGRLILEAVSVAPHQNCFLAERSDGRLLLTAIKTSTAQEVGGESEDAGKVFDEMPEVQIEVVDNDSDEEEEDDDDDSDSASLDGHQSYLKKSSSSDSISAYHYNLQQLRGCKDGRRSLLSWETNYCIPTS